MFKRFNAFPEGANNSSRVISLESASFLLNRIYKGYPLKHPEHIKNVNWSLGFTEILHMVTIKFFSGVDCLQSSHSIHTQKSA